MPPCFMDRNYTLLAASGEKIVEMKNAEPCSVGFWPGKQKSVLASEFKNKNKKKHGC